MIKKIARFFDRKIFKQSFFNQKLLRKQLYSYLMKLNYDPKYDTNYDSNYNSNYDTNYDFNYNNNYDNNYGTNINEYEIIFTIIFN